MIFTMGMDAPWMYAMTRPEIVIERRIVTLSPYISPAAAKIQSFRDLEVGWHYGDGGPINQEVIDTALEFEEIIRNWGFPLTDAFPGVDGGILITGYWDDHDLDIRVQPDNSILVIHTLETDELLASENINSDEAKKLIEKIIGEIRWPTLSVSFTQNTTTGPDVALRVRRFSHPVTSVAAEPQLLIFRASSNTASGFANTSSATIHPVLPASLLSFGGLTQQQYSLPHIS